MNTTAQVPDGSSPEDGNAVKIALDVHAHLAPLREDVPLNGVAWHDGVPHVDGAAVPDARLRQPGELLRWMDAHGVGSAWVSLPPPVYRPALDEAAARVWTEAMNEGLTAFCEADTARLAPLLHLPTWHPELARDTAAAWIARGQRMFAMPAGDAQQAIELSSDRFEALWQALDAARAFVFLHPQRGCDGRLDKFNLHNLVGTPTETAVAAVHLAFAGVPRRHAGIVFCLAHAGGTAPMLVGRLERGQRTASAGLGAEPVRRAMRRFCIECMAHDARTLEFAAAMFGEERVLFGSDWPFAIGIADPAAQLAGTSEPLVSALARRNPLALLRQLELPPSPGEGAFLKST